MKERNLQKTTIKKRERGITLIALVVTIVILIILATISIQAVFSDSGLIRQAERAKEAQANAEIEDQTTMGEYEQYLANTLIASGIENNKSVTNPYDPNGWDVAWTCTNGTWSNIINKGEIAEGDIVAKFYKKGNKITPPSIAGVYTFPEGDEYQLVIEGTGNIGEFMTTSSDGKITGVYGWHTQTAEYVQKFESGDTTATCIIAYVTEATICDGITNIGNNTFQFDTSLTNIKISNSITSIGNNAFAMCVSLPTITIPNGVTNIENSTFTFCTNLTNITIPDSVTSIGNSAFSTCSSLESITIPNSVTSIGDSAFAECSKLQSITIPNSVINLKRAAFAQCTRLRNVIIGNSVTSIGDNTFAQCNSLTSVTIGNSVTNINMNAFMSCENLTKIKILTTDATNFTVNSDVFTNISENSIIYVLSENIKTKLEGTYDTSKTIVQVVTEEEMKNI